jgi:hypothetical protein
MLDPKIRTNDKLATKFAKVSLKIFYINIFFEAFAGLQSLLNSVQINVLKKLESPYLFHAYSFLMSTVSGPENIE